MRRTPRPFNGRIPTRDDLQQQIANLEQRIQNDQTTFKELAKALEDRACELSRLATEKRALRERIEWHEKKHHTAHRLVGELMNANFALIKLLAEKKEPCVYPSADPECDPRCSR